MKKIINKFVSYALFPFLWIYERYFMYRIRDAWGLVHLYNIKNKGNNTRIVGYSRFLEPENLHLGTGVRIGYGCFFFCKGGIEIGDFTIISRNVTIYSASHNYKADIVPYDETYVLKKVKIGRAVWIGMNVCILPGVTIGDGAIIGMGSVVRRDVRPGEIYVCADGGAIRTRDMMRFRDAVSKRKYITSLNPEI